MKKLARSIAIFLITTYIDKNYRYSSTRHSLCMNLISCGSELARDEAVTSSNDVA
jgi:hypothetical protein